MTDGAIWSWIALLLLGAFHGINPGMGWLLAVAFGMQEGRRQAVWRTLVPLTLGHALAIGAVILVAITAGVAVPALRLKYPVAALLIVLGGYRLYRHGHPRLGGMRVGMGRLTAWSFLMATAHGAGLMVVPIFLGMAAPAQGASCHAGAGSSQGDVLMGVLATAVHGAGYLLVTAAAAWIVFERLGLGLLRKAWINLDLIWAGALVVTGALTLTL
jgi:hypothetical protein